MKKQKVIVLYRVIQPWRAPIFDKLNELKDIELNVWHGPDFEGTKVISTKKKYGFNTKKLKSIKLRLKSSNGIIAMPISTLLFFDLILKNPDVVISEGASNLFNSIIGFIYCKLFKKKYLWWSLGKIYNRNYDKKRSKIDFLVQLLEKKSDAIITYSSVGEKYYLDLGINPERIYKAVNVVDTDAILEKIYNVSKFEQIHKEFNFITLFVGALEKEKEVQKLLLAQAQIEKEFPHAGLIIVGGGNYYDELIALTYQLNLKNVVFTGKVIDENYKYFQAADIFVLPGLGGLAISEAMCYGLPVICTTGDGCEVDLVENNGVLDRELTSVTLFEHIKNYIVNPDQKKVAGELSLKKIKTTYNTQNYINQIHNAVIS